MKPAGVVPILQALLCSALWQAGDKVFQTGKGVARAGGLVLAVGLPVRFDCIGIDRLVLQQS